TDVQFTKQLSPNSSFWANLGFTWIASESSNATPTFYVSSHARYLTNFNLQYSHKLFSIILNGLYKMRRGQTGSSPLIAKVSTDYFVLNAKGEVVLVQQKLRAFVEVDNLANRNFTDLLGAQMPGRWFMGGFKISLSK
ncbi:MAG: TonB-dependent receptor, partial [Bacteroidota bacterium]|nr:TonB-dependent receptor [Bacteroidota bacterium]